MARALHTCRFPSVFVVAVMALLLLAGTAMARSGRPHGGLGQIGLSNSRALGTEGCGALRLSRQTQRRTIRTRTGKIFRSVHGCAGSVARASSTQSPVLWGATIGEQMTGTQAPWDMTAVSKFEELAGKQLSMVQFFQPFAECNPSCSFDSFPFTPMENIRGQGSIPVLSWSSQSIPSTLNEPDFQLSDIIEGHDDQFLTKFATEAREWGHPFFLRFDWEMNGNWFPWSEGVNGNQAGEYAAAWRHVHDIFAAVGATNVTWVWCPYVDPEGKLANLASLYPGNAYVDWVGLDGYNWGTNPSSPRGWRTFDQLFHGTYDALTQAVAPGKPVMIAEMGSTEDGGSKSNWIREALGDVPAEYPDVKALLWFDKYDDGMDWPIESSPSATAAFGESIRSPAFVGAPDVNLLGGTIQPPS